MISEHRYGKSPCLKSKCIGSMFQNYVKVSEAKCQTSKDMDGLKMGRVMACLKIGIQFMAFQFKAFLLGKTMIKQWV